MFERREQRTYQANMEKLFPYVCDYWRVQGFNISQPTPYNLHGEHYRSTLGLRRICDVYLREHQGYVYIDAAFRAQLTDEGAVAGTAAAILFFPAAVVGGAISYAEYEDDANRMLWGFWNYAQTVSTSLTANAGAPPPQYVYSKFSEPPPGTHPSQPTPTQPSAPVPSPAAAQVPAPVQQPTAQPPAPIAPSYPPATAQTPKPPVHVPPKRACTSCSTPLEPEWKACPKCGKIAG